MFLLAGLLLALAAQSAELARLAAAAGLAAAVAYSLFFSRTLLRLRAARLQSAAAAGGAGA